MKKSELKQLIREAIQEFSIADLHTILDNPSVKPLLRKLYDNTLNGELCDEDDLNAVVIAAYKVGLSKNDQSMIKESSGGSARCNKSLEEIIKLLGKAEAEVSYSSEMSGGMPTSVGHITGINLICMLFGLKRQAVERAVEKVAKVEKEKLFSQNDKNDSEGSASSEFSIGDIVKTELGEICTVIEIDPKNGNLGIEEIKSGVSWDMVDPKSVTLVKKKKKKISEDHPANKMAVLVNGKKVDVGSISLGGIDHNDRPDYSDAYVEEASFVDGTPLNDQELETLTTEWPELVNDLANEQ